MAKYEINHVCGHQTTQQLFGKQSQRDYAIQRLESRVCPSCWADEQARLREEGNAKAEAWADAHGLLPLNGSEKQVAWAETIRQKLLESLAEIVEDIFEEESPSQTYHPFLKTIKESPFSPENWGIFGDKLLDDGVVATDTLLAAPAMHAVYQLLQEGEARFWIDSRGKSIRGLIVELVELPGKIEAEKRAREERAMEERKKKEEEEEKVRKLWEYRDSMAKRAREILGTKKSFTITVWSNQTNTERRVYINGLGTDKCIYVTGNNRNRPGTADGLGYLEEEKKNEFVELAKELCKKWKRFEIPCEALKEDAQ